MTNCPEFPILLVPTPKAWLEVALQNLDLLLIDHAHCEKKAASTALALIYRHPEHLELIQQLSRLVREELRHFEQVLKILQQRNITYISMPPARYAQGLIKHCRTYEPARLVDTLIVGAFVEARSCERFGALAPLLDEQLGRFYSGLLASEARHYQHYIGFARKIAGEDISERVAEFSKIEEVLITSPDPLFRFHSGV